METNYLDLEEKQMKKKKPVIGIVTNLINVTEGVFAGSERIYLQRDYVRSTLRAGAVPLLLPIIADSDFLFQQVEAIDAIIISGGQDVEPHHYNETPAPWLEATCPERDLYELAVIKAATALKKPIFGICRGLQLINVAFGGSLYQDISKEHVAPSLPHSQKAERHEATHSVEFIEGSWLSTLYTKKNLDTNSFHHQAIKELAPSFQVSCRAKDGIIEGIERIENGSFIAAVQWHPEMMTEQNPDMQRLFEAFVEVTKTIHMSNT